MNRSVAMASLIVLASPLLLAEMNGITVGSGGATVGSDVRIPIYVTAGDSTAFRRLRISITYPAASVTFSKVEPSDAAQEHAVILTAKTAAGDEPSGDYVEVTIQASQKDPVPAGLIGMVSFAIRKDATPGMFKLRVLAAEGWEADESAVKLHADDGDLSIYEEGTAPTVGTCFFYMH